MAQTEILAHWSKLYENFQTSPMEFYGAVLKALKSREIPAYSSSEVNAFEGGIFSAKRVYLRIERRRIAYDICAAPYGTGFFFSSWMIKTRTLAGIWLFIGVAIASYFIWQAVTGSTALAKLIFPQRFAMPPSIFTAFLNPIYVFLGSTLFSILVGLCIFLILVLFLGWLINIELIPGEESVLEIPILGKIYEMIYHPVTYYKTDTALMFQTTVHSALMEAIDEVTSSKGIRPLTELERKPIMKDFLRK
jgi:hypothetical protein